MTPDAPINEATCGPWPYPSTGVVSIPAEPPVKSRNATMRLAGMSSLGAIPESMTATPIPAPVVHL